MRCHVILARVGLPTIDWHVKIGTILETSSEFFEQLAEINIKLTSQRNLTIASLLSTSSWEVSSLAATSRSVRQPFGTSELD